MKDGHSFALDAMQVIWLFDQVDSSNSQVSSFIMSLTQKIGLQDRFAILAMRFFKISA